MSAPSFEDEESMPPTRAGEQEKTPHSSSVLSAESQLADQAIPSAAYPLIRSAPTPMPDVHGARKVRPKGGRS
jgi:hypothetical protein